MNLRIYRLILTVLLLGSSASAFVLDWSANHLLSPAWHPHARFHGGLLLFLLAGVALTGTWLLWRDSREPSVALHLAALLLLSFWTPLLYVGLLVPGSSPWAGREGAVPRIGGAAFYPNMAVAAGVVLFTSFVWWAGRREAKKRP